MDGGTKNANKPSDRDKPAVHETLAQLIRYGDKETLGITKKFCMLFDTLEEMSKTGHVSRFVAESQTYLEGLLETYHLYCKVVNCAETEDQIKITKESYTEIRSMLLIIINAVYSVKPLLVELDKKLKSGDESGYRRLMEEIEKIGVSMETHYLTDIPPRTTTE